MALGRKLAAVGEPPPGRRAAQFIPGLRSRRYVPPPPTYDGPAGQGQPKSTTGRQQAPFKPGQTERTRQLRRRTRPTPGSAERRNRRQYD